MEAHWDVWLENAQSFCWRSDRNSLLLLTMHQIQWNNSIIDFFSVSDECDLHRLVVCGLFADEQCFIAYRTKVLGWGQV